VRESFAAAGGAGAAAEALTRLADSGPAASGREREGSLESLS